MMTVYDVDKETMFTFMENNGVKQRMGIALPTASAADAALNESSVKITATGNTKSILGYTCQEYKMTGDEMNATIWVTKDANLRFPSDYYKIEQQNNANQTWMKDIDGWLMEMEMIDSSKRKPQTIIMKCLSINDSSLQIKSDDYQSFGY